MQITEMKNDKSLKKNLNELHDKVNLITELTDIMKLPSIKETFKKIPTTT